MDLTEGFELVEGSDKKELKRHFSRRLAHWAEPWVIGAAANPPNFPERVKLRGFGPARVALTASEASSQT